MANNAVACQTLGPIQQGSMNCDDDSTSKDPNIEGRDLLDSETGKTAQQIALERNVSVYRAKLKSRWRDMWKVPSAMLALFLLSWIVAAIHFILFRVLDGKRADGPHSVPQSYVATMSHLLGLLFRSSLCGALTIAFTQCLWRLLRLKATRVSTIEVMFKITQNPLMLAFPEAVRTTSTLYVLALLTWLLPLAITFPPGALIVVSSSEISLAATKVPTYQGSFIGNGSEPDARRYSLAIRTTSGGRYFYTNPIPSMERLSTLSWETGNIDAATSPCGLNCKFHLSFEGPFLRCNSTILERRYDEYYSNSVLGSGGCPVNALRVEQPDFLTTVFERSQSLTPPENNGTVHEVEVISCSAARASYDVDIEYRDGVRSISHSSSDKGTLDDTWPLYDVGYLLPPTSEKCPKNASACAAPGILELLTLFNHLALIDAFFKPVMGNYSMTKYQTFQDFSNGASMPFQCGGTLAGDTSLNIQRDNFTRSPTDGPEFRVSEEILNEALFNYTMNVSLRLGYWHNTTEAQVTSFYNTYSFAYPKRLLLPYLICLGIAVPFIYLGLRSLRLNGVSAIQDGFIQILMTTKGSRSLDNATAPGCLGGDENIPAELLKLRIRFGELTGSENSQGVVRAGFGTEDEVVPLRRGIAYGT